MTAIAIATLVTSTIMFSSFIAAEEEESENEVWSVIFLFASIFGLTWSIAYFLGA